MGSSEVCLRSLLRSQRFQRARWSQLLLNPRRLQRWERTIRLLGLTLWKKRNGKQLNFGAAVDPPTGVRGVADTGGLLTPVNATDSSWKPLLTASDRRSFPAVTSCCKALRFWFTEVICASILFVSGLRLVFCSDFEPESCQSKLAKRDKISCSWANEYLLDVLSSEYSCDSLARSAANDLWS